MLLSKFFSPPFVNSFFTYGPWKNKYLTNLSVIISTGLIALVDDSIKRHFHPRPHSQRPKSSSHASHSSHPHATHSPLKLDMEFVNPKAIVSHMFRRRDSEGSNKSRKHSPLRYAQPVETTYPKH